MGVAVDAAGAGPGVAGAAMDAAVVLIGAKSPMLWSMRSPHLLEEILKV